MNNYYDVLNVLSDATKTEIVESYHKLIKLFNEDNLAIYGLYSPEMLSEKIQEIDLAHQILTDSTKRDTYDEELKEKKLKVRTETHGLMSFRKFKKFDEEIHDKKTTKKEEPTPKKIDKPKPEEKKTVEEVFRGKVFRKIRKEQKISLDEISRVTKINSKILQAIEKEDFAALPARPYLRGFIVAFANYLKSDSDKAVQEYLFLYDDWKKDN